LYNITQNLLVSSIQYQNRLILLFQEQFIKTPFNIKINTHILTDVIYRKHKECNGIKRIDYSTIALAKSAVERIPLALHS
jgi:TRAP-type mannitol/chloroaromatic compound transport system permease small subunit